jgi:hypothetical protein
MVRMLVVLLWISLVIGTYVSGNVVGNWVVCLLGLYVFIRSRRRQSSPTTATGPSVLPSRTSRPAPAVTAVPPHSSADQQRGRRWR